MRHLVALAVIAASAATAAASPMDPDERVCPSEVRGVRISSSPLRDGVAFTFRVAKQTQVPGLRALLREAAVIVSQRSKEAALHPEVMPTSDGEGAVAALDIFVRDTPTGAIVTVRPEESFLVGLLQRNAHDFELFWSQHDCVSTPMMAMDATVRSSLHASPEPVAASSPRTAARSTVAHARSIARAP